MSPPSPPVVTPLMTSSLRRSYSRGFLLSRRQQLVSTHALSKPTRAVRRKAWFYGICSKTKQECSHLGSWRSGAEAWVTPKHRDQVKQKSDYAELPSQGTAPPQRRMSLPANIGWRCRDPGYPSPENLCNSLGTPHKTVFSPGRHSVDKTARHTLPTSENGSPRQQI